MPLHHDPDIYHSFIRRIPNEAKYGHRYFCMFAAAVLALQCGINEEQYFSDMENLMPVLTAIYPAEPMRSGDLETALAIYRDKTQRRHRYEYLSELSGIQIEKKPYNHEPRRDSKKIIEEWKRQNPDGTRKRCSEETGIPYSTVCSHWRRRVACSSKMARRKKKK